MEKVFEFDFVFDTQRVFRKVMDAMSRPMNSYSISEEANGFDGDNKTMLAVAATLLDNETKFYVEKNTALQKAIADITLARDITPNKAEYILLSSELNYETIRSLFHNAKKGTLADPQLSATFIIMCDAFEGTEQMRVKGPGINGTTQLHTTNYIKEICKIHNSFPVEYPCGIDLIFISKKGDVMCFPRLCKVSEVEG